MTGFGNWGKKKEKKKPVCRFTGQSSYDILIIMMITKKYLLTCKLNKLNGISGYQV